jgi:hypothetical protein
MRSEWFRQWANGIGVQNMYARPHTVFTATTPVIRFRDKIFTVSDVLSACTYISDFIKANFDVSLTRYGETLLLLKSVNLMLNNQMQKNPTKERLHYFVDVVHEITDMQAQCEESKRANAKIAMTLNAMIDCCSPRE